MQTATQNIELPIQYHSGQHEFFFDSQEKLKVISKGRRWGLTRGYANRAIEYLLDGISPGLWVDTVNSNIDRYVERYFYPVLNLIPQNYWKWRQQRKELEICGHKLDIRSADRPELIEGFGYKFIMLNEAGIILRKSYLYHNSILPMIADYNPDVYIGGTPKGRGLFHELAVQASDPANKDQQYFKYSTYQNPLLTKRAIKKLNEQIPESIQKQELEGEFLEDSSTVFRNLRKCAVSKPKEPKEGQVYYMGVDLAKHKDFTVIVVLDAEGNQVFMDRFNKLDWSFQRQKIIQVWQKYNEAYCWVDATGVGDPNVEELQKEMSQVEGYVFTNASKKQLIQSLMMSLEQENIKILSKKYAPELFNEMQIFEYEITASGLLRYNAPEGSHDDCVIALALANWGLQNQVEAGFMMA